MAKKRGETSMEESSGNVFEDLGLIHLKERLAKADLAITISRQVRVRRLTQAEATDLFGVAQSDVSNPMRARFSGYSIERLTRLLNALGPDVEIRVRPTRRGKCGTRWVAHG